MPQSRLMSAESATENAPIDPTHRTGLEPDRTQLDVIGCPGCGSDVATTAVACPDCGRKTLVEHPGDLERVKHSPTDLPPASEAAFGPTDTASAEDPSSDAGKPR